MRHTSITLPALKRVIAEEQEIAPMALAVIRSLDDFPLTYGELFVIMKFFEPSEHKIEELTQTHVKLIIA